MKEVDAMIILRNIPYDELRDYRSLNEALTLPKKDENYKEFSRFVRLKAANLQVE